MGILSLVFMAAGGFLAGLLVVAALVAGWELLRQRDLLIQMRRDRALYAASSPLPLAGTAEAGRSARALGAAPLTGAAVAMAQRDPKWIETRPMVLRSAAVDDETRADQRELDLQLE